MREHCAGLRLEKKNKESMMKEKLEVKEVRRDDVMPLDCIHLNWRKCPEKKDICCAYCPVVNDRISDCPKACIAASERKEFNCEVMPERYKLRVMSYIAYTNHQGLAWLSNILKELQKKYDVVMGLVKKIADAGEAFAKKEQKKKSKKIIVPGKE